MKKENSKVTDYWNKRGETYSRSWQSVAKKNLSRFETNFVTEALSTLSKRIKNRPIKTLDIGIAIGRVTDEILKYNVDHYAVDISKTMIQFCEKKYKDNKKIHQLKIYDVNNPLPKNWNNFDMISAIRVLSYSSDLKKQLNNIYSALNDDGIVVFTWPNKYSSTVISKLLNRKSRLGYEMSYQELKNIIKEVGFSHCEIVGLSRLLDTFYDKSNSELSATILFSIEKILDIILGPVLFTRLFYITCRK